MEMERGEAGGFHGYRRPPTPPPSSSEKLPAEINMSTLPHHEIHNNTSNRHHRRHNNHHSVAADDGECAVREQDRFMPIANVIRIMRKILPQHAKISDDAKETIQECVSEFISFITGEANDRCQREQRKTITAEDVLWAMSKLGFDEYIEPLTLYLNRYRELEGDRGSIRGDQPLVKRSSVPVDFGTTSVSYAPPPPVFHMGMGHHRHHHHHHGFYGVVPVPPPPMAGFFNKDGSNAAAGPSQAAVASMEPYAPRNKVNNY